MMKVAVDFDSEVTSKLHYDDIVCEKQIGEVHLVHLQ